MADWVYVPLFIVAGFIVGLVFSRIVYSQAANEKRPEAIQQVARPLASLTLAIGVIIGLVAALGVIAPDSLAQLPHDLVAFIPKVLVAALIIIVANVLVSFATAALSQALGRAPAYLQRQAILIVKSLIYVMAAMLAVSQLGVDTEVVNLALGALFFGTAATMTLLIGLGGHPVAREVASTRALKRLIGKGDSVTVGDVSGVVAAVHPTAVEVVNPAGHTVLVPSSSFLRHKVSIDRADPDLAPQTAP